MFSLLNSSQIYGLQQTHEKNVATKPASNSSTAAAAHKQRRSASNASDTSKESKFLATFSVTSPGMKSPTNFIEKFIKSELLNGYDTIKNYKNFHQSAGKSQGHHGGPHTAGIGASFSCLHGSYRSSVEGEFYDTANTNNRAQHYNNNSNNLKTDMIDEQHVGAKLSDSEMDQSSSLLNSSGASSGEFNSSDSASTTTTTHTATAATFNNSNNNGFFKKAQNSSNASTLAQSLTGSIGNATEIASDHSSSSLSTTANSSKSSSSANNITSSKSNVRQGSASTPTLVPRERLKMGCSMLALQQRSSPETISDTPSIAATAVEFVGSATPTGRQQRQNLIQMISSYEQQNKMLQYELGRERHRRHEELACVVKSLLCFESKLKMDLKNVHQRLLEKDVEICRLVRQNRTLRKELQRQRRDYEGENAKDEGVEEDAGPTSGSTAENTFSDEDCLVPEALQCNNCRKQFYDIELRQNCTQTSKDGNRANDDHANTGFGSSSDDTVSSSFYGARRSVRYTSKRTTGTFRDYMRSRCMHIDDDDADDDGEDAAAEDDEDDGVPLEPENINSCCSDSQRSYEKMPSSSSSSSTCPMDLLAPQFLLQLLLLWLLAREFERVSAALLPLLFTPCMRSMVRE